MATNSNLETHVRRSAFCFFLFELFKFVCLWLERPECVKEPSEGRCRTSLPQFEFFQYLPIICSWWERSKGV